MSLHPPNRFLGQLGTDHFVVVERMSRISPADLRVPHLFEELASLRFFAKDKRILFDKTDYMVVFDINERWMAVHDRHSEIVFKPQFKRAGFSSPFQFGRPLPKPRCHLPMQAVA